MAQLLSRRLEKKRQRARERLEEFSSMGVEDVLYSLGSRPQGLSAEEVSASRSAHKIRADKKRIGPQLSQWWYRVINLSVLPALVVALAYGVRYWLLPNAGTTDDEVNPVRAFVCLGVALAMLLLELMRRFRIRQTTSTISSMAPNAIRCLRQESPVRYIPVHDLVVGDIIYLSQGNRIPCDLRIIQSDGLRIDESEIGGAHTPSLKGSKPYVGPLPVEYCSSLALTGGTVTSGNGWGVVLSAGRNCLSAQLQAGVKPNADGFSTDGLDSYPAWLVELSQVLAIATVLAVPIMFLISMLTKGSLFESALLALSMLMLLVPGRLVLVVQDVFATRLKQMARQGITPLEPNAVADVAGINVLCCDTLGVLMDEDIRLEYCMGPDGKGSELALYWGRVIAHIDSVQDGHSEFAFSRTLGPLEGADLPRLLAREQAHTTTAPVSYLLEESDGERYFVLKGAPRSVVAKCAGAYLDGNYKELSDAVRWSAMRIAYRLEREGLRVVALAERAAQAGQTALEHDTGGFTLLGFLAFNESPKAELADSLKTLSELGIETKVLSSATPASVRRLCSSLGLPRQSIVSGTDVASYSDAELARRARRARFFCGLDAQAKTRVVSALKNQGLKVAYWATSSSEVECERAAQVGIVDYYSTASARAAAKVLVPKRDLSGAVDAVCSARETLAATSRAAVLYLIGAIILGGALGVSIFVSPFLPMYAAHLLLLVLLLDLCSLAFRSIELEREACREAPQLDTADALHTAARVALPRIAVALGALAVLMLVLCPAEIGFEWWEIEELAVRENFTGLFRGAWLGVLGICLAVGLVMGRSLGTKKMRHASAPLVVTAVIGVVVLCALPFLPFAELLDVLAPPFMWLVFMAGVVLVAVVVQLVLSLRQR
ncbi:MAG: hypothetical protein IJ125_02315 [Atopobiaceae bacterium]|nr:hypothetical protein [Atopobiaceae bacterium]